MRRKPLVLNTETVLVGNNPCINLHGKQFLFLSFSRYSCLWEVDLTELPLPSLAADDALIVTWVTNKQKLLRYVKEELFPLWHVTHVATWYWIKVKMLIFYI